MSQMPPSPSGSTTPEIPPFDPGAPHMQRPRLRPVRGFPVQAKTQDGQPITLLGLSDAQQVSRKQIGLPPAFQHVMPLLDGSRTVEEVVAQVGQGLQVPMLQTVVSQLDAAGLLEGPTFDALLADMRQQFDEVEDLPPGSTADFADMLVQQHMVQEAQAKGEEPRRATDEEKEAQGATRFGEILDSWMDQAADAFGKQGQEVTLSELPRAIVAPHIDYGRGWSNYAAIWSKLRGAERPDRVLVLGTNHFGRGTGVTACEKGFRTPLGTCKADREAVEHLKSRLGEPLTTSQYDHENEHSIELQIPWIQRVFGADASGAFVPVVGVLVHDPLVNGGQSYDGAGVGLDEFVEAVRSAIDELGGRTLVVVSADLSHVGPAFGDQQNLAGEDEGAKALREKVLTHDKEMLAIVETGSADDLIGAMSWQQNPTRWCSIGALSACLKALEPERVEPVNYLAAMDQQGMSLVSSAAMLIR
ncbi:MAG: AmmeMemoRadiSam system protein B [Phycisphaerales bacterium]|nr:MAG: AmmeMemoRadiSam system protein B [Phycisphaerales bacterium]